MPRFLAVILAWAAVGLPGSAARLVPLTIEQLAGRADAVVHGIVRSVEVARDPQGRVFTRAELQVLEVWKGTVAAGLCRVVTGGGVLGEVALSTSEQPRYAVDDEVVVYLLNRGSDEWITVGLSQGRFGVRAEEGTGRRWVEGRFWGGPPSGRAGGAVQGRLPFPAERPIDLEELKRRTRETAR